jgi:hypothetical protein
MHRPPTQREVSKALSILQAYGRYGTAEQQEPHPSPPQPIWQRR